ncbi:MAG: exopolysaccharide biosynthesis polyprenyl glycosylphosphotransferase [Bacteroidota bacterium]|nr:exopolysaccharide biosynthesis polyprenyl glycosylphosphotransferase [Bacteroidota bacterium]
MTRYSQYIKRINIVSDFVILNGCYTAVFYYKFGAFHPPFSFMLMYINIAWFFATSIIKPYDISRTSNFMRVLRSSVWVLLVHMLLVFAYYVFEQAHRYSRELLLMMYSGLFIATFIYKLIFHLGIRYARRKGWNYRNIIIVTQEDNPVQLQTFLSTHPEYGYRVNKVVKVVDPADNNYHEELKEYCLKNGVHEIFYSMSLVNYDTLADLMNFAEENLIRMRLIADFKWVTFRDLELERYGEIPVMKVHTSPLDDWDKQLAKRVFDIIFSFAIMVLLLSWLLPLLALLIRLDSKGSAFFRQRRTGRDNKWFWCYKLRTMYVNEHSDTRQATSNDDRITPFGKFLRNSSLDELPQFFNVFIGDMSVVGPRPHMLKHTEDFSAEVDKFMSRHKIKPGITGLAQSKGYRGETDEMEKKKNRVKLDLFYMNNWSFFFDIKIIFNTIGVLFKPAYKSEP